MPRGPAAVDALGRAIALAQREPLVVGAAAAVLLALVAAYLLRRRRSTAERFRRALAAPDAVTVLMHPNPDPDAMACALGVAHLAEEAGTDAEIRYPGQIRHQENRAFRTVFDLDFEPIEAAADLEGEVVLVDHNEPRGFEGCGTLSAYAVVDHHPGGGSGREFTDVRPDYGACATILAEYFEALGAEPDPGDAEAAMALPWELSTGLVYGILSDTNHLTRGCSAAEFDASAYLYPGVDEDALDRIANPPVDAAVLDTIAAAITGREVRGPFAVSDVGRVENVDAIPQAADELLRLEGLTAVVVLGEADGTIHLSGRSRDDRLHMGDALRDAVAEIAMSDAGGHARMGGGQVSMPHLRGLRPESGMTREEFVDRLFAVMEGET